MKTGSKRIARMLWSLAAFFFLLASLGAKTALTADAPQIIATVACSSENALWQGAEQIADEMKFGEIVRGFKAIAANNYELLNSLDPTKPFGLVVATDKNEIVPFFYLPINGEIDEDDLNELKSKIAEKVDRFKFELFVKDSTLFGCAPQYKDLVPTNVEDFGKIDDQTALIAIDVNLEAVPREFLEAGFAELRRKIAEQTSDQSEEEIESLNSLLEYYSSVADSIKKVKASICVDESHNLSFKFSLDAKEGSDLAKYLQDSGAAQSRWNALYDTSNAIFASVSAGKQVEGLKEFRLNQFKNVACKNLLNQLDVLIDDPDDFEIAKDLIVLVQEEAIASIESGAFDGGIAVGVDPIVVKFASSISKPDGLKKAMQTIVDRLKKDVDDIEKYVVLDAEKIEGFSVSKIDVPMEKIDVDAKVKALQGKTLCARIGIDEKSIAVALGLNGAETDAEFAKLAASAKESQPVKRSSFFDLVPLAKILYEVGTELGDVRPVALDSIEKVSQAGSIKLSYVEEYKNSGFEAKFEIDRKLFKVAGDVVRLNLAGGQKEDNSEDLDDLFDEE